MSGVGPDSRSCLGSRVDKFGVEIERRRVFRYIEVSRDPADGFDREQLGVEHLQGNRMHTVHERKRSRQLVRPTKPSSCYWQTGLRPSLFFLQICFKMDIVKHPQSVAIDDQRQRQTQLVPVNVLKTVYITCHVRP